MHQAEKSLRLRLFGTLAGMIEPEEFLDGKVDMMIVGLKALLSTSTIRCVHDKCGNLSLDPHFSQKIKKGYKTFQEFRQKYHAQADKVHSNCIQKVFVAYAPLSFSHLTSRNRGQSQMPFLCA
jgi:hypothetical protein